MHSREGRRQDSDDRIKENKNSFHRAASSTARKGAERFVTPLTTFADCDSMILPPEEKDTNFNPKILAKQSENSIDRFIPLFKKIILLSVLLSRQNNVRRWDRIIFRLIKTAFEGNSPAGTSVQNIIKLFRDIISLNYSLLVEIPQNLKQDSCDFTDTFHTFYDTVSFNFTSLVLSKEKMLNIHTIRRRQQRITRKSTAHRTNAGESKSYFASGDFNVVPVMNHSEHTKCHQLLRLLCVFTNDLNIERVNSWIINSWATQDVKIILPEAFNVVVSRNIVTISDMSKHQIRICFRSPLKAVKIDCDNQDFPSIKNCNLGKTINSNSVLRNKASQSRKTKFFCNKIAINNNIQEASKVEMNRLAKETNIDKQNQDFPTVTNMANSASNNNSLMKAHNESTCQCNIKFLLRKKLLLNAISENDHQVIGNNQENKRKSQTSRRKISRTALKRVNVKQIGSSVFRNFFQFYSLLGGHLRSGAVMTKSNSNYWLIVSGAVTDSYTLKLAEDLFTAVAGAKVVLNIFDYLQFLITFARNRKLIVAELVKQIMVWEEPFMDTITKESFVGKLS